MSDFFSNPKSVMSKHGKSFYFASMIFSRDTINKVALLYAFCRFVDDAADELKQEDSIKILSEVRKLTAHNNESLAPLNPLKSVNGSSIKCLSKVISTLESYGVQRKQMIELIEGAEFEIKSKVVNTQQDLLQYCYLVAGVVGLMMCPLIGVKDKEAAAEYAIGLGNAMQITNICRDVLEDAQAGRNYLPKDLLNLNDIKSDQLKIQGPTPLALKNLIKHLLNYADGLYEKSYGGLAYIPLRSRICILVAGEVYRSIGRKIRQTDYEVLKGRTYLSLSEKIIVIVKLLPRFFNFKFWSVSSAQALRSLQ